jgi:hypothetical protein
MDITPHFAALSGSVDVEFDNVDLVTVFCSNRL